MPDSSGEADAMTTPKATTEAQLGGRGVLVRPGSAVLSPCGTFRYRLSRDVAGGPGGRAAFVMLNPSKADADDDDPTIRKCRGFAKRWGLSGFDVVNLFAFRATDPKKLARAWVETSSNLLPEATIGPDNDAWIRRVVHDACLVVLAWGRLPHRSMVARRDDVLRIVRFARGPSVCLGKTQCGNPRHPLMLAYATPQQPWSTTP